MSDYLKDLEKGCGNQMVGVKGMQIHCGEAKRLCDYCSRKLDGYIEGLKDGEQKGCKDTEDKIIEILDKSKSDYQGIYLVEKCIREIKKELSGDKT